MRYQTRLNPQQAAKLSQLEGLHAQKVQFNATIEAEIRAQIADKSRDFELRESRLMNEAKALGIPKTAIGRAVGLANWAILEQKYKLTAEEFIEVEREQYILDWPNRTLVLFWWDFPDGQRVSVDDGVWITLEDNGLTAFPMGEPTDAIGVYANANGFVRETNVGVNALNWDNQSFHIE